MIAPKHMFLPMLEFSEGTSYRFTGMVWIFWIRLGFQNMSAIKRPFEHFPGTLHIKEKLLTTWGPIFEYIDS